MRREESANTRLASNTPTLARILRIEAAVTETGVTGRVSMNGHRYISNPEAQVAACSESNAKRKCA